MVPRKQAGYMICTRPPAECPILLAMRALSTHDPVGTSLDKSLRLEPIGTRIEAESHTSRNEIIVRSHRNVLGRRLNVADVALDR